MRIKIFGVFSLIIFVVFSCNKDNNSTNISATGSKKSHNVGQNCMSCHISGGKGEGWFQGAGTVYDSLLTKVNPNGFIELYTEPDGAGVLVKRIPVDGLGNFYTTESISFVNGLYPSVVSSTGKKKFMASSISNGACNACHGISQDKIWVSN